MPTNPADAQHEGPTQTKDDFGDLYNQAQEARASLRKRWSARAPSPQEVASELEGTVLSLLIKVIRASGVSRDMMFGDMEQFHDRLLDLEQDGTQFAPEDAEKFLALCDVVKHLTTMLRDSGTLDEAQLVKLGEADKLADQCAEIVHETTLGDDEDEEGGPAPGAGGDDDDEDARAERGN